MISLAYGSERLKGQSELDQWTRAAVAALFPVAIYLAYYVFSARRARSAWIVTSAALVTIPLFVNCGCRLADTLPGGYIDREALIAAAFNAVMLGGIWTFALRSRTAS